MGGDRLLPSAGGFGGINDMHPLNPLGEAGNGGRALVSSSSSSQGGRGRDREAEKEERLAWFRNDPDLNTHFANWAVMFTTIPPPMPLSGAFGGGGRRREAERLVQQGERFLYMLDQLLRRYDVERISLGLHPTAPVDIGAAQVRMRESGGGVEGYVRGRQRIEKRRRVRRGTDT